MISSFFNNKICCRTIADAVKFTCTIYKDLEKELRKNAYLIKIDFHQNFFSF